MAAFALHLLACLPYVTCSVFLLGLAKRIGHWHRSKVVPAPLFPRPVRPAAAWRRLAAEICLLRGSHAGDPGLWIGAWPLHVALFAIAVGHVRAFVDFPDLWRTLGLGPERVDALAGLAGGVVGLVAMLACLYLLAWRLFVRRLREITRMQDLWTLLLLLAVVVSGNAMRLGSPVDLEPIRAYFAALARLHPVPMPEIPGFATHFLLAQGLLAWAPFGKLLHAPGLFWAKADLYRCGERRMP